MTHEPLCPTKDWPEGSVPCDLCNLIRAAYRRGYNDHARAAQHWQDTHGAYRQHGEGENP